MKDKKDQDIEEEETDSSSKIPRRWKRVREWSQNKISNFNRLSDLMKK